MATTVFHRLRLGCLIAVSVALTLAVLTSALLIIPALRIPDDAPLARMYRAETDITALAKAVDTYFNAHQAYPPAGVEGLRLATDLLSGSIEHFPGGPPADPWGHPYQYVPYTQYGESGTATLRGQSGYCAPGRYQLYSMGADGDAGIDDPEKQRDNVCNWDAGKSWRPVYKALQRTYKDIPRRPL